MKTRLSRIHLNRHNLNRNHLSSLKVTSTIPARIHPRHHLPQAEATEVQSERFVQPEPDRVWMVAQWKWDLDASTPWYRKLFFWYVYRPFIRFAWNAMKIPAPKGITVEGNKQTVFWFENAGFFSNEDAADVACATIWHGYKDVPFERRIPDESCQYSSLVFPRQKDKRQRTSPTFSIVAKDRKQDERERATLAEYLAQLNQVLDRR